MRGRTLSLDTLKRQHKLTCVASGRCVVSGDPVRISIDLAHPDTSAVVWAGVFNGRESDVTMIEGLLGESVVRAITSAIFEFELRRSRAQLSLGSGLNTVSLK